MGGHDTINPRGKSGNGALAGELPQFFTKKNQRWASRKYQHLYFATDITPTSKGQQKTAV